MKINNNEYLFTLKKNNEHILCYMKYAHVLYTNTDEPKTNDLSLHNHMLHEIY